MRKLEMAGLMGVGSLRTHTGISCTIARRVADRLTCQTHQLSTVGFGMVQYVSVKLLRIFSYTARITQPLRLTDEACWYRTSLLQMVQAGLIESSPASRMSMPATDLLYVVIPVAFLVASSAHQELHFLGVICGNVLVVEVFD